MLTHVIHRYEPKRAIAKNGKPKFINGSEDHRRHILSSTVERINADKTFASTNEFKIKGRSSGAWLLNVIDDYKSVKWDGLKVKCIEFFIPEEQGFDLFHPSDVCPLGKKRK